MNMKVWAVIITVVVAAIILSGCMALNCYKKDPHDYVPGWSDNRLEFGQSYKLLVLHDVAGVPHPHTNTVPGWYSTSNGVPIDYVVMCK